MIDVHNHFLPTRYIDTLEGLDTTVQIEDRDGRKWVEHPRLSFPLAEGFHRMDARIDWMETHGIETTIVSVSMPGVLSTHFTAAQSTTLSRAINDGYAELQDEHPERIAALGAIPMREPRAAMDELDRIVDELDLPGFALPTHIGGRSWSDPEFAPVFRRLSELGLPVFVHPQTNQLSQSLTKEEALLTPMAVFPTDTTFQMCRLIFDGFFDRFNFPIVLSHLGGTIPYLVGRWEIGLENIGIYELSEPEQPITSYVESFYYDTISFHLPSLELALETVGSEQLLLGTDFPFPIEESERSIQDLKDLELPPEELDAITSGTAEELFQLG